MDPEVNSHNVSTDENSTETYKGVCRNHIPDKILRSGAVESLISHNEDLMSRLQVTVRRISILEEKLHQSDKIRKKIDLHYKNLQDQVLVLGEREKHLRKRKELAEGQFNSLKQRIRLLEIEYARLYTSSQEEKITFMNTIESLNQRTRWLSKSKSKLSSVAHKFRKSYKQAQQELEVVNRDFITLRTKLEESVSYIQGQAQGFIDEKKALEEENKKKVDELQKELSVLRKKRDQFDQIYDENVKLQNQLVFVQRKNDENRDNFNSEVVKLQDSLSHYRSQAKSQALSIDNYATDTKEKDSQISELKKEVTVLKEQLESVQCLWKDGQEKMEKQAQTNESLQKMNQQVSTQLNRYRQEINEVRNKFEGERQEAADKIRHMKAHIQAIRLFSKEGSNQKGVEKKGFSPVVNNLIDTLTEMESGFNKEL